MCSVYIQLFSSASAIQALGMAEAYRSHWLLFLLMKMILPSILNERKKSIVTHTSKSSLHFIVLVLVSP